MTIYDHTGKIVEKKFYHSEWKLTDLLKARNDGLLTDEGEAWKYRYSHMDGTGGKYDLLFRREPATIEAPAQKPVAWRVRERPGFNWHFIDGDPDRDPTLRGHERQPLYTTPPDHLAIERAAYERGAEAGWNAARTSVYGICEAIEDRANTDLEKPQVSEYGTGYLEAEKSTAKHIRRAMGSFEAKDDDNFLALLTQEGR